MSYATSLQAKYDCHVIVANSYAANFKEDLENLGTSIDKVLRSQNSAFARCCVNMEKKSDGTLTPKTDAQLRYTQLSPLVGSLIASVQPSGASSAPTPQLIAGEHIASLLDGYAGDSLHIVRFEIDAAGGSSRTFNPFLLSIFYTPAPRYSGGAVITYSITKRTGDFEAGGTVRYMHDYSAVHSIGGIYSSSNSPHALPTEDWNGRYDVKSCKNVQFGTSDNAGSRRNVCVPK
jgi:hypothetical protein